MNESHVESIVKNDDLLRKIVYSIEKAIGDDIKQYYQENHLETHNAVVQLRGDYINDNLRNHVVNDNVELVPFKRSGWTGRIIVDRINHITYTITTLGTLAGVPKKKQRSKPHYLQSILYVENKTCIGENNQITLNDFGIVIFDPASLERDYNGISQGLLNKDDNYRHYIVAYNAEHGEIKEILLKYLDKDFNVVDETSLNDYLRPDFTRLTDINTADVIYDEEEPEERRRLTTIKSKIQPKLRSIDKKA